MSGRRSNGAAALRRLGSGHYQALVPDQRFGGYHSLGVHDLRHHAGDTMAAPMAARSGGTLRDVMVPLGHSSPTAALRYQHAAAERDRAIAEGMDGLLAQVSREPRAAVLRVTATQPRENLARGARNGRSA